MARYGFSFTDVNCMLNNVQYRERVEGHEDLISTLNRDTNFINLPVVPITK